MMKRFWQVAFFLLICVSSSAQYTNWLNVKSAPFNANGGGVVDDYAALQACIDSALKTNGTVYIPTGTYSISAPLIVQRWSGTQYQQSYINIVGDDVMGTPGITVIAPTFKNTFAFGFHLNKGTTMRGLTIRGLYDMSGITVDSLYKSPSTFVGDASCRDTRYSPYSAIVIDPFRGAVPPDGGYPGLTSYYRGSDNVSGSTGMMFFDINIEGFSVGAIISPNGKTLNGELMTFENIVVSDCKVAFAGCQAQEKGNRMINWALLEKIRTAFVFDTYGQAHPGHYIIDGLYAGYGVCDLVYRQSTGYFPMFMNNAIAEDIARIGNWSTSVNDAIINSTFSFIYWDTTGNKSITSPHLIGTGGLTLMNVQLRYKGHPEMPVLLTSNIAEIYNVKGDSATVNPVIGLYIANNQPTWAYQYGWTDSLFTQATINWYDDGGVRRAVITDNIPPALGSVMIICVPGNAAPVGSAVVTAVTPGVNYTVSYMGASVQNATSYRLYKYTNALKPNWKPNEINGSPNITDTIIVQGGGGGVTDTIILFRNVRRTP